HPDIKLEIVTTNGFLNPSKREADLAVMLARPIKGPLVARKLSNYGLGLYAAASYVEQNGVPRTTLDLRSHAMIGYIPDFIYADELRYLQEIDDKLSPGLSSSSINIQLGLTLQGMGLCVLPNFVATHHPTLGRILPEIEIERAFWIVVHRDFAKVARIRAVMDWLDALVQKAVL
ncbi:MAG: LysR substrate-binding domain-containing protein, partial [Sphingorhabdus sp.]